MRDSQYRALMTVAALMTAAWIGWSFYDGMLKEGNPGDADYLAGSTAFEDGHYGKALKDFDSALDTDPGHLHALRGRAMSLMQLGRLDQALAEFDAVVAVEPDSGPTIANRGILHDRMGHYRLALADYELALRLAPELVDGPGWLTRFLRKQPERPPTIADRARYLRAELAKPESERVMRNPEQDANQRPYKM
jgi:tetratricopeptide (TPR) repeat protein